MSDISKKNDETNQNRNFFTNTTTDGRTGPLLMDNDVVMHPAEQSSTKRKFGEKQSETNKKQKILHPATFKHFSLLVPGSLVRWFHKNGVITCLSKTRITVHDKKQQVWVIDDAQGKEHASMMGVKIPENERTQTFESIRKS
jgi:hypothetical protein